MADANQDPRLFQALQGLSSGFNPNAPQQQMPPPSAAPGASAPSGPALPMSNAIQQGPAIHNNPLYNQQTEQLEAPPQAAPSNVANINSQHISKLAQHIKDLQAQRESGK